MVNTAIPVGDDVPIIVAILKPTVFMCSFSRQVSSGILASDMSAKIFGLSDLRQVP